MKENKLEKGKKYENIAKDFLEKKGYTFLEKNYKTSYGEIDLIFKDGKSLVIVEVKARKKNDFQNIENTINIKKIKRILKTTEIYIKEHSVDFEEIRLDAIFIEERGKFYNISHFINWI